MALKSKAGSETNEGVDGKADWEDLSSMSTSNIPRRGIFMDITGLEGAGKSSLAMTLAEVGPLGYVDIDQSADRAKKPEGKKQRDGIKILPVRYAIGLSEETVKANCAEAWFNLEKRVGEAAARWAKGVVIDTGTEGWELIRLASFGTLTPRGRRMDRLYGPVNAKYRQLHRTVYRTHGKHLITIHQLKEEYVDRLKEGEMQSVRTGKMLRAGFKEIGYLSDLAVRCYREDGEFKAEIQVCKLSPNGPALEGVSVEGDDLNFASILALATDTTREDWLRAR